MTSDQRFIGYPRAREGPQTVYALSEDQNPVLRGWVLVIAANLVARSSLVAHAIWSNAKFGIIKDIPALRDYDYRLEPIVTPLGPEAGVPDKRAITPELSRRQPDRLAGRFYSAADYHELYKSGKLTPIQVAKTLLPLISRGQNPPAKYEKAWALTVESIALAAAQASTDRYAAGNALGVLDGVPFAVKDDIDVQGYRSHTGLQYNKAVPSFEPAKETIWPIAQLEAAGALMIGKVAMHEMGSDTSGCNPRWGSPINWNNPAYYPGGSSSGGGSALSAGLIPIAIGTDAGGSIRIPSAFCGMYGLKPTLHRVFTMKSAICVIGPKAATVADLTMAYRLMETPNPQDAIQGRFAPSVPPSPTAKRTIGIYREWFDKASPVVLDATNKAIAHFEDKMGYNVVDITIPYIREGQLAHSAWALVELMDSMRGKAPSPGSCLDYVNHPNKILMSMGAETGAIDLVKYGQIRELIMQHLAFLWEKHPGMLILTPTTPIAGWKIQSGDEAYGFSDGNLTIRNMMYIWLANSTGCPALSAPVGYADPEQGEGKLPIGLMAMGEWGAEESLLAWAQEAETYLNDVLEGGRVRPKDWVDVIKSAGQ